MTKAGAIAILTTVFMGLFAWAGSTVVDNKVKIAELVKEKDNTIALLTEVRNDVKKLLEKK